MILLSILLDLIDIESDMDSIRESIIHCYFILIYLSRANHELDKHLWAELPWDITVNEHIVWSEDNTWNLMEKGLKRVDQMGSIQPYLEVRPGLLKGVKLNEKMRKNLWKIFDYVREIISAWVEYWSFNWIFNLSELAEYSREGGEESTGLRLHFEKGQEIDLPEGERILDH